MRGRSWLEEYARSDLCVTPEGYTMSCARQKEHGTPGMRDAAGISLKGYDRVSFGEIVVTG